MRLICQPMGQGGRRFEVVFFSRREAQVLAGICCGWSNKQIAAALGISTSTVGSIVATLRRLLNKATRNDLLIWALDHRGLFADPPKAGIALHPSGCTCDRIYCSAMRMAASRREPAA